jgi:hypothetical protein
VHEGNGGNVRFTIPGMDQLLVKEILDQWWGEDATYFKVRADDDKRYILKHKRPEIFGL